MNETSTCESSSTNDENINIKKSVSIESDDENDEKNSVPKQHLEKSHTNSQSFSKINKVKRNKNKTKKPKHKPNSERNMASKKENGYAHIPNRYILFVY